MKETVCVIVGAIEDQKTINKYESFGWKLMSNQIVHDYDWMADHSSLTFQRETKIRNYLEIVKLEKQYDELAGQLKDIPYIMKPKEDDSYIKERRKGKISVFFGVIFVISGIYSPIARFSLGKTDDSLPDIVFILSVIFCILFGLILLFYGVKSIQTSKENMRKAGKDYENQMTSFEKEMAEQDCKIKSIKKQMDVLKNKAWMLVDL